MDKPLEFILVPKCPLFGDSTVFDLIPKLFLARTPPGWLAKNRILHIQGFIWAEIINFFVGEGGGGEGEEELQFHEFRLTFWNFFGVGGNISLRRRTYPFSFSR